MHTSNGIGESLGRGPSTRLTTSASYHLNVIRKVSAMPRAIDQLPSQMLDKE